MTGIDDALGYGREKGSSLVRKLVNYRRKKLYNIGPLKGRLPALYANIRARATLGVIQVHSCIRKQSVRTTPAMGLFQSVLISPQSMFFFKVWSVTLNLVLELSMSFCSANQPDG